MNISLGFAPPTGTSLTLVRNTGISFIAGRFTNLMHGQVLALSHNGLSHKFIANYYGGTGNDLTLEWYRRGIVGWGANSSGQLGTGNLTGSHVPVAAMNDGALANKTVLAIATGTGGHTLALCSDGSMAAWGNNIFGQLGNGSTTNSSVPVSVPRTGALAGKVVIAIAAGSHHSIALCSDASLVTWGLNHAGQLGNGSFVNSSVPVLVFRSGALANKFGVAIAADGNQNLVLCSDGTVASWGDNTHGQLGNGSTVGNSNLPVAVDHSGVLVGKTVSAISVGNAHALALCTDGHMAAWGTNLSGRLGNNSLSLSRVPVLVNRAGALAGKIPIAIAAGTSHNLAHCSDGTLVAWGAGSNGQLGNNSVADSKVPVLVNRAGILAGRFISSLAAGNAHSLVTCTDGTAAAWGLNSSGQLGDGTTTGAKVPVAVTKTGLLAQQRARLADGGNACSLALASIPPSSSLSNLVVGGANIFPAFAPGVLNYTSRLPIGNASITIRPTAQSEFATIKVNGVAVSSGAFSQSIPFSQGSAPVQIVVTAENGSTTTYRIQAPTGVNGTFTSGSVIPVTAAGYIASGKDLNLLLSFEPQPGTQLMVVRNTSLHFIAGRFDNLAHGQVVSLPYNGLKYRFVADYYGGSGNDLVLVWAHQQAFAWGSNGFGLLGNPAVSQSGVSQSDGPVEVDGSGVLAGKTLIRIAAGETHSLALCSDGTVAAWGTNDHGQLGNGTTVTALQPVQVEVSGGMLGKIVIDVAAGIASSLALCSDGTVFAWGSNTSGQLGDGTFVGSLVPRAVDSSGVLAGRTIVAISAGWSHGLALCSEGRMFAWGQNQFGNLGNGNTTPSNVPVSVADSGVLGGKVVTAISAGGSHNLALCSDGKIAAWGAGSNGRLGNNSTANSNVPVLVNSSGILTGKVVVGVSAGGAHSLALCSDGTIAAWGLNSIGQLGDGSFAFKSLPVEVNRTGAMSGKMPVQLAVGSLHSVAVCSDGTAFAWGDNTSKQLGSGEATPIHNLPVEVLNSGTLEGKRIMKGAAGRRHSLAIAAAPLSNDSKLSGLQLSTGTLDVSLNHQRNEYHCAVAHGTTSVTITPTARNAMALIKVNGVPVASGSPSGAIPLPTGSTLITVAVTAENGGFTVYTINVVKSSHIVATINSVTQIPATHPAFDATGLSVNLSLGFAPPAGTTLMILRNTGLNAITGHFTNLVHGQEISLPFGGKSYRFVANYFGGSGNDLVLESALRGLTGWGVGHHGEPGTPADGTNRLPVSIPQSGALLGKTVVALSASSGSFSLALCSDGSVASWGHNSSGQLGDGTTTPREIPVAVDASGILSGKTVISVKAGSSYSLALCSDGTIAAWGYNFHGQLGDGTTQNRISPVKVTDTGALMGRKVVAIDAYSSHSLALCSDGTMVSWGSNQSGKLGVPNVSSSPVPVAVPQRGALQGRTVLAISAGASHTMALCSDGTLTAWGANTSGQLGNGNNSSTNIPVEVSTEGVLSGKTILAAGCSGNISHALTSDGLIATWGAGLEGQLGNGSSVDSNVPVAVAASGILAGRSVLDVSSGALHMVARCNDGSLIAWGSNSDGRLGDGTEVGSNVPVAVAPTGFLSDKAVISVSAGVGQNLAICSVPASSRLSGLVLESGDLSADFHPDLLTYQYSQAASITSIKVTPTTESGFASVKVNGVGVLSGTASAGIPLTTGSPPLQILVTAEDGGTTNYTITPPSNLYAVFSSADDVPVVLPRYHADGWTIGLSLAFAPPTGTNLMAIRNLGPAFMKGKFVNLPQGGEVGLAFAGVTYRFVANYHGGSGNDLVLEWANRSLASWGDFLGDGTDGESTIPVAVDHSGVLMGKTVVSLSASSFSTLALCADGTLAGWGSNAFGQLGIGQVPSTQVPVVLNQGALQGKSVIAAHTGSVASLALCSDGTLAAWGGGNILEFASGSASNITIPVEVPRLGALAGKEVVAVSVGANHFLVLCADGTMVSWGSNTYGQLGSGAIGTTAADLPVQVVTPPAMAGRKVISIGTGTNHSAALCSDGTVFSWGLRYGEVGPNKNSSIPEPQGLVGDLVGKEVVSLAVSSSNLAALCSDGTVATWGRGDVGQIGNGSTSDQRWPFKVNGYGALIGRVATSVAVGNNNIFATCSDGSVLGWGGNIGGQLGVGDAFNRNSPTLVEPSSELFGSIPIAVASGGISHSHAILAFPENGYINWASGRPGLTDKTENGDPDADGIPNIVEYVLDGDPARASTYILPVVSLSGTEFIFTFDRLASSTGDTDQDFQYSNDMIHWTDVDITAPGEAGVMIGTVDAHGKQSVSVTVPKGSNTRLFGRLRIDRR